MSRLIPRNCASPGQLEIFWLSFRYRAKALGVNTQRRIELTPKVLKRDRSGQLDDLCLGVVLRQSGEKCVIDLLICDRDTLGIFKRDAFRLAEQSAVAP